VQSGSRTDNEDLVAVAAANAAAAVASAAVNSQDIDCFLHAIDSAGSDGMGGESGPFGGAASSPSGVSSDGAVAAAAAAAAASYQAGAAEGLFGSSGGFFRRYLGSRTFEDRVSSCRRRNAE